MTETNGYRKGVEHGIKEADWTAKRLLAWLAVPAVLLLLAVLVMKIVGVGLGVAERVVNPDAIVQNYEWYEQQFRDIKAAEGQIKDADEAIKRFKDDSGPAKEWRFDQREEYARLNANLQGLKSYRRNLIEAYNGKASMITRNLWKSGSLPHQIEQ